MNIAVFYYYYYYYYHHHHHRRHHHQKNQHSIYCLLITIFMYMQVTRICNCCPSDIIMLGEDSNSMITLNQ
jgi:uncharacterized membrane-anchored protein